jgi:acetate kinase
MREPILVINAGSSSIKFSLFETTADRLLAAGAHGQVSGIGTTPRIEVTDPQGHKLIDQSAMIADHRGAIAAIRDWFATHIGTESQPGKCEIAADALLFARVVVDDRALAIEMGAVGGAGLGADAIHAELGEILAGT